MFNSNLWNKIRYTFYTPIYDLITEKFFYVSRKESISNLKIKPNDKILIVGAGTGLDLEFLPHDIEIHAIDITPVMISKLNLKANKLNLNVKSQVMDGQNLEFRNEYFDHIILHLILAVIPDPYKTIKEVERVLKTNGKIAVFDKFADENKTVSSLRKGLNLITAILFSSINRKIQDIISVTNLKIVSQRNAIFYGWFKIIMLIK